MDKNELKTVAEELLVEKVVKLKKTEEGLHNYNFIIETQNRKLIAKVAGSNSAIMSRALKKQFVFLKKYDKSLNIPVAVAYSEKNIIKRPILFLNFLEGTHLDFNDLSLDQVTSMAKEVARIHLISAKKYSYDYAAPPLHKGTFHDYAKVFTSAKVFKQYDQFACYISNKNHREIIEKGLDALKKELQNKKFFRRSKFSLLHTDLGKYNLIWKQDKPFFIDWDDKMYGDPASEVGYIFAINNSDSVFRKTFLNEYKKYVWDVYFQERIEFYELMNRLFDVMWSLSKFDENSDTLKTKSRKVYEGYYLERYLNLENYLHIKKIA